MIKFLNRMVDKTFGKIADEVLSIWDHPTLRQKRVTLKRFFKHRQAVLRTIDRTRSDAWYWKPILWMRSAQMLVVRGCRRLRLAMRQAYRATASGVTRLMESRAMRQVGRGISRCGQMCRRALRAQVEAWRWMGRMLLAPFRGKHSKPMVISDSAPTGATMPDGVLAMIDCVACGHEVLGTNMKKYYKFRCPRCKSELLVIDPVRGLSMEVSRGERRSSVVVKEKSETEESEPVRV
jgi:hypothetical protein